MLTLCYISPLQVSSVSAAVTGPERQKTTGRLESLPARAQSESWVEGLPAEQLARQHHPQCEQPYERSRCNDRFHPSRLPQNLVPTSHFTDVCYIRFSLLLTLCYIYPSTLDDSGLRRAKKNRETRGSPGTLTDENYRVRDYRRRSFLGSTTQSVNNPKNAPAAMIASIQLPRKLLSTTYFTQRCYILFSIVLTLCYIREISHHCSLRDNQERNLIAASLWDGTIPGLAEDGKGLKEAGRPWGLPATLSTSCGVSGSGAHLAPDHWV